MYFMCNGRRFDTLQLATDYASAFFERLGIVLAIVEYPN